MNNIRAFVAVDIDNPQVVQRIELVQGEIKSSGAAVVKEVELINLHITLKFLGEIDHYRVEQVKKEIQAIEFEPFEIELRGMGYFPGGGRVNVIWIGVEDPTGLLNRLGEEVQRRMERLGFRQEKFTPHLTVARVKAIKNRDKLLKIISSHADELFGQQRIDRILLKKSTLTPRGPIYEDIMRHEGNVKRA